MIHLEQEKYILHHAYIPEHILDLMVGLSAGEPFYENGFVFFVKKDLLIFIGYPLTNISSGKEFVPTLQDCLKKFRPEITWFIAPEIPCSLSNQVQERESDYYYILKISAANFPRPLIRETEKAARHLTVEKSRNFSPEHIQLANEYLTRETLPLRIKELFTRLPHYINFSSSSLILSAWDRQGKLSAYFVIELASEKFITYVLGAYSQKNYTPHASDLLLYETYKLAKEINKDYIHLGLGVNEGIRRFKIKWGGIPYLPYEAGALVPKCRSSLSWLNVLREKL